MSLIKHKILDFQDFFFIITLITLFSMLTFSRRYRILRK